VALSISGLAVRIRMGKSFASAAVDGLYVGGLTIAAIKEAKTLIMLNYQSAKAAGLSEEAKAARRASTVPMLWCIGVNVLCVLGLLTRKLLTTHTFKVSQGLYNFEHIPYMYLAMMIMKRVCMLPPLLYLIYWAHESRSSGKSPLAELATAAGAVSRHIYGGMDVLYNSAAKFGGNQSNPAQPSSDPIQHEYMRVSSRDPLSGEAMKFVKRATLLEPATDTPSSHTAAEMIEEDENGEEDEEGDVFELPTEMPTDLRRQANQDASKAKGFWAKAAKQTMSASTSKKGGKWEHAIEELSANAMDEWLNSEHESAKKLGRTDTFAKLGQD